MQAGSSVNLGAGAVSGARMGAIAAGLIEARAARRALRSYPGRIPETLAEAYEVQEAAIALTKDELVGWKVAMIPPELRERFGAERICGPIFRGGLIENNVGNEPSFTIIPGGFAAVEAEFVLEVGTDVPPDVPEGLTDDGVDTLVPYLAAQRIGIEIAGSPIADLNGLGSAAVVSDFGGNDGLILGPALDFDRQPAPDKMTTEMRVDGVTVGTGTGAKIPGGPLAALRFLVGQLASRGRRLKAGDLVSTGATTGIHPIAAGSAFHALFDGYMQLRGRAVAPSTT